MRLLSVHSAHAPCERPLAGALCAPQGLVERLFWMTGVHCVAIPAAATWGWFALAAARRLADWAGPDFQLAETGSTCEAAGAKLGLPGGASSWLLAADRKLLFWLALLPALDVADASLRLDAALLTAAAGETVLPAMPSAEIFEGMGRRA